MLQIHPSKTADDVVDEEYYFDKLTTTGWQKLR
jgi:hypothetical protein